MARAKGDPWPQQDVAIVQFRADFGGVAPWGDGNVTQVTMTALDNRDSSGGQANMNLYGINRGVPTFLNLANSTPGSLSVITQALNQPPYQAYKAQLAIGGAPSEVWTLLIPQNNQGTVGATNPVLNKLAANPSDPTGNTVLVFTRCEYTNGANAAGVSLDLEVLDPATNNWVNVNTAVILLRTSGVRYFEGQTKTAYKNQAGQFSFRWRLHNTVFPDQIYAFTL
jgi:hypothetical protein